MPRRSIKPAVFARCENGVAGDEGTAVGEPAVEKSRRPSPELTTVERKAEGAPALSAEKKAPLPVEACEMEPHSAALAARARAGVWTVVGGGAAVGGVVVGSVVVGGCC